MATKRQGATLNYKFLNDLSGGLNDTLVNTLVPDKDATAATNIFVNLRGGAEKRYGYTSDAATITQNNTDFARLLGYKSLTATPGDTIFFANKYDVYIPTITNFQSGGPTSFPTYTNGTATFTNGSTTVSRVTGTAEYLTQVAVSDMISADSGTTWYTVNSITDNSTIVLSSNFTGTTGNYSITVRQRGMAYPIKGVMYNGSLFYGPLTWQANGQSSTTGTMAYYNVTNGNKRVTPPTGILPGVFAVYKNYLFTADIGYTKGARLWWSALLDGTSWPSTNFVDVNPQDGESIRALIVHNDILYIFKDHSIYYLIGDTFDPNNPTYSLKKVINPQNIGTFNGESVKVFQNRIVFLGNDGIYAVEGVNGVINLSENKIRTTIRSILNLSQPVTANGTNPEAAAVVYDNRYWLSVKTVSGSTNVNDLTICIEPNGAFTRHSFAAQNFILGQTASKNVLLGLSASDWTYLQFDGTATSDGSSATNATFTTKVFGFGDFTATTRVEDVYVAYQNAANQAASLKVFDDNGQVGSTTAWTFPGGTTQFITVQRFAIDRDTNGLYLTITDNTSAKGFRILGIIIRYWKDMTGSGVIVTT